MDSGVKVHSDPDGDPIVFHTSGGSSICHPAWLLGLGVVVITTRIAAFCPHPCWDADARSPSVADSSKNPRLALPSLPSRCMSF